MAVIQRKTEVGCTGLPGAQGQAAQAEQEWRATVRAILSFLTQQHLGGIKLT